MAVLGNNYPDMLDFLKAQGADGLVSSTVIEMLAALSPVYRFGRYAPCNMVNKHRHVIRTGLGTAAWGKIYKGIASSKGSTAQVEDTTGMLEALSGMDERLLRLYGEAEAKKMRLLDSEGQLETMMQEFETGFFYHDTATTPEKFKGLAARYAALATSGPGLQIVDGGGTGSDNTSIWFATWGDRYTSLLYPSNSKAGIHHEDKGKQRVLDDNGDPYYIMEDYFSLDVGCTVGDWRYNSRVANLDVSDMAAGTVSINPLMTKAHYKLKNRQIPPSSGQQVIYMNKAVLEALDNEGTNNVGSDNYVRLKPMEIQGQEVKSWRGIPIVETEGLINTEARVV